MVINEQLLTKKRDNLVIKIFFIIALQLLADKSVYYEIYTRFATVGSIIHLSNNITYIQSFYKTKMY